jgi:hypothetical protein
MANELETLLADLGSLLRAGGEHAYADLVEQTLAGGDHAVEALLLSDELWGGAGSIADQAFFRDTQRRKELELLLIKLGRLRMKTGKVDPRTTMWVTAFEQWDAS